MKGRLRSTAENRGQTLAQVRRSCRCREGGEAEGHGLTSPPEELLALAAEPGHTALEGNARRGAVGRQGLSLAPHPLP